MKILAYLNTYNRYDTTLPLALWSLVNQTRKPDKIIVFDDNKTENCKDLRTVEHYNYIFKTMDQKGIAYEYRWGHKKGAHFNHEDANMMGFDAAWFIDDDNVAEPNVLEILEKELVDGVGAVGGLIMKPIATQKPSYVNGLLEDIWKGENLAWYKWEGKPKECEHLYSGFLYRCGIVHHDLRLTKKVFRGETMFTHSMFLKGYKLICTPKAITWHYESAGGCRSQEQEATNKEMYDHDSWVFSEWLKFKQTKQKMYVLREGLGDHYAFLQAYPLEKDAIYAVCYPELFQGYKTVSIGEAEQVIDPKDYKVYEFMERNKWKGNLVEAYRELYKHIFHENPHK